VTGRRMDLPALPIEAQPYETVNLSLSIPGYLHHQWVYRFLNDYGASVVQGTHTYGGPQLYELAVIRFDGDKFGLTYETPITDDVLGWLTLEDVAATLVKVAAL
jgi:hypothetical protein